MLNNIDMSVADNCLTEAKKMLLIGLVTELEAVELKKGYLRPN